MLYWLNDKSKCNVVSKQNDNGRRCCIDWMIRANVMLFQNKMTMVEDVVLIEW